MVKFSSVYFSMLNFELLVFNDILSIVENALVSVNLLLDKFSETLLFKFFVAYSFLFLFLFFLK